MFFEKLLLYDYYYLILLNKLCWQEYLLSQVSLATDKWELLQAEKIE